MNPNHLRLLLKWNHVVRLKAVLPSLQSTDLDSLGMLVDSLSVLSSPDLSVVFAADGWGYLRGSDFSHASCSPDECASGHLECRASHREFQHLLKRMAEVSSATQR